MALNSHRLQKTLALVVWLWLGMVRSEEDSDLSGCSV